MNTEEQQPNGPASPPVEVKKKVIGIEIDTFNKVTQYLVTKPWAEVNELLGGLSKAQEVVLNG